MVKHEVEPYGEPYGSFADIYDRIMDSVDYEGWADYVEQLLKMHPTKFSVEKIIDLACGTGSSTLPFARRGYKVTGIDLSEAMLKQAREKTWRQGLQVNYLLQDIRSLKLTGMYDLALLFQDGLNYILCEKELAETFRGIYQIINAGGLFIFDLTRPGLRYTDKKGSTCVAELEELTLIMESSYETSEDLWSARLTVFQETEHGLYKKYREEHREKDYDPDKVKEILNRTGFYVHAIYPSFKLEPACSSDQKLTFVAERTA